MRERHIGKKNPLRLGVIPGLRIMCVCLSIVRQIVQSKATLTFILSANIWTDNLVRAAQGRNRLVYAKPKCNNRTNPHITPKEISNLAKEY